MDLKIDNNISDIIEELNNDYQIIKKNMYWNYDKKYYINGLVVDENDMLMELSKKIIKGIDRTKLDLKLNSAVSYEIPNIDYDKMKNIVLSFFLTIDPNYSDKLAYIFSNVHVIDGKGRSYASIDGINFYNNNDLASLITLTHEVSHCLANLDENNIINDKNKVTAFAEIESELTEEIFLKSLLESNFLVVDKNSDELKPRPLNQNDINCIKYNKYKGSVIETSYRAIEELNFKRIINQANIDENLIQKICTMYNVPLNDENEKYICKRIEKFLKPYNPTQNQKYDENGYYDPKNGEHLSNESRFIYAYCFVEKFNNSNLNEEEKINFYRSYINDVKNMSFEDVLTKFNVDLSNPLSITDDFIKEFNNIVNNNEDAKKL